MNYICHSGGCEGADMCWETEGLKYGVKTISYSFYNHRQSGANQKILTVDELNEGYEAARKADKTLKRNFDGITYPYIKNLLGRNWFQVKNSDAVFAVGKMLNDRIVEGGTGWAVQMAIDNEKPVYVFNQEKNVWLTFLYDVGIFSEYYEIPKLTKDFAGIGTRELKPCGIEAITQVYKNTFGY
jgi:hypothetical protein